MELADIVVTLQCSVDIKPVLKCRLANILRKALRDVIRYNNERFQMSTKIFGCDDGC